MWVVKQRKYCRVWRHGDLWVGVGWYVSGMRPDLVSCVAYVYVFMCVLLCVSLVASGTCIISFLFI